jgi:hypothetical protein
VVPDEDSPISFAYWPCACRNPGSAIESRHFDELTLTVKTPAVEGTCNAVAAHTSADAEMGTEMRTVGIKDARTSILATEHHQIAIEVLCRLHLAWAEIRCCADAEPTVG